MSVLDFIKEAQLLVEQFGNHTRRYRIQVEKELPALLDRLDEQNLNYEEYFFNLWPEVEYQLMLLEQLNQNREERLSVIKLLFAFHYLKMNVECVRFLEGGISERIEHPFKIYRKVLIRVRQTFLTLSRGLMNRLSYHLTPIPNLPRYVFFNVGSLVDHEDIDVGLVHDGEKSSQDLDHYIGQLSQKFFKTVTQLHFYLAEALDVDHYGANIELYLDYLNNNNDDFIFVSQLLGATRLTGDMELFYEFKAKIVERYFRGNSHHRLHYIDLATKEIERICSKPLSEQTIHPKSECYRVFTMLSSALRISFQIHRGNIWETFDQFLHYDYENRIFYELLKDAYAFVQIFRYLFNLFVSQKDIISFDDPAEGKLLDNIAQIMGMNDRTALHRDYHYIAGRGRESAQHLARNLRKRFLDDA